MAAKLYHFTAEHLISSIIHNGLTMGGIPISIDPPEIITGYRWLSVRKKWNQSWCDPRYSTLPYRRDAYRLTIKIPNRFKGNIINWLKYCEKNDLGSAVILNSWGDPQNWRLYHGDIDPRWIVRVDRNPMN